MGEAAPSLLVVLKSIAEDVLIFAQRIKNNAARELSYLANDPRLIQLLGFVLEVQWSA